MGNSDSSKPGGKRKKSTQSIPQGGVSEVMGLVELIKSKGGKDDIYKLAQELQMEFGDTVNVIRSAETLGFVRIQGGDVLLESLGDEVTNLKVSDRKDLIRGQLEKLPLVQQIEAALRENDSNELNREELAQRLHELVPNEDTDTLFQNLVAWGRYAELFGYNDDREVFYLDH